MPAVHADAATGSRAVDTRAPTRCGTDTRFTFIDTAKAAGIVLVVLAHSPGLPTALMNAIYSFHMPLFFFISGFLLPPRRLDSAWLSQVHRVAKTMLVPYLFFFLISLGYWLATRSLGDRAVKFAGVTAGDALVGLATGLASDLFINVALWFFPCLFCCAVLYATLRRWLGAGTLLLVAAGVSLLSVTWGPLLAGVPWGLGIASVSLVFYAGGQWWRGRMGPAPDGHRAALRVLPWLGVPTALLWAALVLVQGRVDLAEANFGPFPWLYVPCAAAGIVAVVAIAAQAPQSPALRWLADKSLVIFPLHLLLLNFLSGIFKLALPGLTLGGYGPAWSLPFALLCLAACVPLANGLTRHLPRALGRTPQGAAA